MVLYTENSLKTNQSHKFENSYVITQSENSYVVTHVKYTRQEVFCTHTIFSCERMLQS